MTLTPEERAKLKALRDKAAALGREAYEETTNQAIREEYAALCMDLVSAALDAPEPTDEPSTGLKTLPGTKCPDCDGYSPFNPDDCTRCGNTGRIAEPTADLTALKCAVADAYRAKEEAWESSISHDPEIDDHLRNTWLALDAAYAALVAAQEGGLTNGE